MDATLLESLTSVSETLLKRPGTISIDSIKKLASFYGFDTWLEKLDTDLGMVSLSNTPKAIMSPLATSLITSPVHVRRKSGSSHESQRSRLTLNLDRVVIDIDFTSPGLITGVSVSVGTDSQLNSLQYDFIKGWDGALNVGEILLANLSNNETLDQFNMNLRVLYMMDRLSKPSPHDIFSIFNSIVGSLHQENQINNIGELLSNYKNKVGVFLKYWRDDKHINDWIQQNKGIQMDSNDYLIHFKVKEGGFKDFKINDEYLTTQSNNGNDTWFIDGKWQIPHDSNVIETLSFIQLEFCSPVWIPKDIVDLMGYHYKVIDQNNKNWGANTKLGSGSGSGSTSLDSFYTYMNEDGSVKVNDYNITYSIGCQMIKLFKIQGLDLTKFSQLINILRSWIKLSSILNKMVQQYGIQRNDEEINNINIDDIVLDDLNNDDVDMITSEKEKKWINVSIGDWKTGSISVETSSSKFQIINGVASDNIIEISESFI